MQGARDNDLFGYGLVVGLAGTGDNQTMLFTQQSIAGMLGRLGVRVDAQQVRARNVAAVMVTTRLPAFTRPGERLDISVASLGNASSLAGGVLLITPLTGADGQVYAVAQGAVQVGGYDVSSGGSSMMKNTPTSGRVPGGASVERRDPGPGRRHPAPRPAPARLHHREPHRGRHREGPGRRRQGARRRRRRGDRSRGVQGGSGGPAGEASRRWRSRPTCAPRWSSPSAPARGRPASGRGSGRWPLARRPAGVSVAAQLRLAAGTAGSRDANPNAAARWWWTQTTATATEESRGTQALPATTTVQELARPSPPWERARGDLGSILQAMKAAGALDAELEVM